MTTLRILTCRVGQAPTVEDINSDLPTMQKIVGGYIQNVPIGHEFLIVCNEDGMSLKLLQNACGMLGDFFFTKRVNEDFGSLTDSDITRCRNYYNTYRHQLHPSLFGGGSGLQVIPVDSLDEMWQILDKARQLANDEFDQAQNQPRS